MDTDLKKKLNQVTETPDPQVWKNVQKGLARSSFFKKVLAFLCGIVVVGGIVFSIIARQEGTDKSAIAGPEKEVATAAVKSADDSVAKTQQKVAKSAQSAPQVSQPTAKSAEPNKVEEVVSDLLAVPADIVEKEPAAIVTGEQLASVDNVATNIATSISAHDSHAAEVKSSVASNTNLADKSSLADSAVLVKSSTDGAAVELRMPNVLLPNDDNPLNRTFRVYANGPLASYRLYVYNRRGALVYQSSDINASWDGTYSGSPVAQGTYVYVIRYTDKNGKAHEQKGTVSVLR